MRGSAIALWIARYRLFLRFCPGRFRKAYGREMLHVFRQRLERAHTRDGLMATVCCACSGVCDVILSGFLQRMIEKRVPVRDRSSSEKGDHLIHRLHQNMRLTFRSMRRSPAFTATVLATLALGSGVTIAMFAVMDGALLGPLPYPRSEKLVSVNSIDPKFGAGAF